MTSRLEGRDIVIIIVAILLIIIFFAGGMLGVGMMGPFGYGMMGGSASPLWAAFVLIFWVLVIGGIAFLVIWALRSSETKPAWKPIEPIKEDPVEILKERYAKGEITKDQYDQMRKDLG